LLREVYTIIERRLEKSVEAYIASLSAETLGQLDDTADNSTAGTLVAKAINAMDAIIGGGTGDGEGEQQPFDPLDSAIASQIKKQAGEWSEDIHTWIWLVLDTSPLRSKDALRTCEWFLSQLETLERAAGQGAKRLRHELATIAEQLQQAIAEQGVRKLRSQGRRGNTLDDTILQYARLRVFLVAHRGVLQILRTLRGGVTKASDRLRELNKDLNQLACQFRESDAPPSYADREVHGACSASPAMLWSRRDELAARVDLTVESVLGPVQRRLVELMEGVNVQRHSLPPILRKAARQVVVKAWKTAQSSALAEICASKDQDDSGHWGALTESAATSTLYALAAGRRWFLTLPDLETLSPLADQLRAESGTEPTIIEDARGQTAAWYELGGVGLTDVARQLVAQHPEIIAIADRLKTRLDVDWSPL